MHTQAFIYGRPPNASGRTGSAIFRVSDVDSGVDAGSGTSVISTDGSGFCPTTCRDMSRSEPAHLYCDIRSTAINTCCDSVSVSGSNEYCDGAEALRLC